MADPPPPHLAPEEHADDIKTPPPDTPNQSPDGTVGAHDAVSRHIIDEDALSGDNSDRIHIDSDRDEDEDAGSGDEEKTVTFDDTPVVWVDETYVDGMCGDAYFIWRMS